MRIPYSWLAEHCDTGLEPEVLAERMAMTGTEVERVITVGPAETDGFVIGKVLSAEKHPNADRLNLCRVDTGDEGTDDGKPGRQIVCGAPNVAAGQTVVVSLPGAVMPDGMKIGKAKLRGILSEGMICSERELGLGEEHDGILALEIEAEPGSPAAAVLPLGEPVLELEVTPNRTDCLGLYGVAREAHAITGAPLGDAPWRGGPIGPGITGADLAVDGAGEGGDGEPVSDRIQITVEDPELCPRFTARGFADVKVGASPLWLRTRLVLAGMRPINNVVDITNYVMWLTGQPMHAFDLGLIGGAELAIRPAKAGEKLTTLDDQERELIAGMTVVADGNGAVAIAGVMGGATTEVSDATTSVLLEAATWNGPDILTTSRDLALRSEASNRFEKQLHPALTLRAQAVATRLMVELCGATVMAGTVDVAAPEPDPEPIRLRVGRVERVLGLEVPVEAQVQALESLAFEVRQVEGDLLAIAPPERRFDVTREIDLIEEIGRLADLDRKLPATLPSGPGRVGGLSRQQVLQRRAEDSMREAGFHEIVGWSFTDPGEAGRLRLDAPDPRSIPVALSNPLSEDQSVMRTTLVGSVLGAASRNRARGAGRLALFESGRVYLPAGESGPGPLGGDFPGDRRPPVNEPQHLCAALSGPVNPASWAETEPGAGFFALKGVLEGLAAGLEVGIEVAPLGDAADQPFLHPGRAGRVLTAGREIGWIGEIHPAVADGLDLDGVTAFEIALADLLEPSPLGDETYREFTAFPPVDRDLAVVVKDETPAAVVIDAVGTAGGELLTGVTIFDLYRGKGLGEGEKSLALRLRFRADDRTLGEGEIDPVWRQVIASVEQIGGRIRG
ncbi:MAG: phenylalanine--tRNA ligase subunit beta [Solirubrobacterales bacterium]|nr:phenylalanine--tRNA ligase subunit beta [Solirubrobacterales bacterium]